MKKSIFLTALLLALGGCGLPGWMHVEEPRKSEMLQNYYLEKARKNLAAVPLNQPKHGKMPCVWWKMPAGSSVTHLPMSNPSSRSKAA